MDAEYFHFKLQGHAQFALPLSSAVEVLRITPQQICAIPGVDLALIGVTKWRGQLLWSVDLSALLKVRQTNSPTAGRPTSTITAIVIAQAQPLRRLACVVNDLKGVLSLSPEQIKPPSTQLPEAARDYISGIVPLEAPLILLDPRAILSSPCWKLSSG